MTSVTATAARATTTPTTSVRVGLALSIILGLANLPFLFLTLDWGPQEPPFGMLLVNAALGMVSVICAAIAWNSANRLAIRVNAAALIINAILIVPGLVFEGVPAWIPVLSAATVVTTVIAVVLMMRRTSAPVPVID